MNRLIEAVCTECGAEQSVEEVFGNATINCVKCQAELKVIGQQNNNTNGLVKGPLACDKHSTDMCDACDIDLGTCDTIWAAGGALYCSRECGIHDYSMMSNISAKDAEQLFNEEAEEINPQDIGIVRRCDHEA